MEHGAIVKRELDVILTPADIELKKNRLPQVELELRAKEKDKKTAADAHNKGIRESETERDELTDAIHSGKERREVECMVVRDDRRAEEAIKRLDTDEIVETRPYTFEEREALGMSGGPDDEDDSDEDGEE